MRTDFKEEGLLSCIQRAEDVFAENVSGVDLIEAPGHREALSDSHRGQCRCVYVAYACSCGGVVSGARAEAGAAESISRGSHLSSFEPSHDAPRFVPLRSAPPQALACLADLLKRGRRPDDLSSWIIGTIRKMRDRGERQRRCFLLDGGGLDMGEIFQNRDLEQIVREIEGYLPAPFTPLELEGIAQAAPQPVVLHVAAQLLRKLRNKDPDRPIAITGWIIVTARGVMERGEMCATPTNPTASGTNHTHLLPPMGGD